MTLTWKSSEVAQSLVDLLKSNHEGSDLQDVYYGDQRRLPRIPAATVAPSTRNRNFNQTGLQYEIELTTFIYVYHGGIKDLQTITKDCDELVETLEATINADRKLSNTIIHGRIASVEPGFMERGNALFVVHQMEHVAISRQQVGS